MKLALIGFPQSGKTTVFQALGAIASLPPADPNKPYIVTLTLADARLLALSKLVDAKKVTFGQIVLMDSPLLTAHPDKGLNFAQMREAESFVTVLDSFMNDDPLAEWEKMEAEIIRQDLESTKAPLEKMTKEMSKGRKEREKEFQALSKCEKMLQERKLLRNVVFTAEEKKLLSAYSFLSTKPNFALLNIDETSLGKKGEQPAAFEKRGISCMALCAKIEKELYELAEGERGEFMKEAGLAEFSQQRFCNFLLTSMGFISFFTVGEKDSRAWLLEKGSTVLQAAGKIHTDIAKGFIKAEVISTKDYLELGSLVKAKEKGVLRLESKEYIVQDGDVLNIRFSP